MPRDCKHGQLARSCDICGLESEREQLARALMLLIHSRSLTPDEMDTVLDAAKMAKEILGD